MSAERDAFDAALKALMVAEDCVDDGQIITSYILVGTAVGGDEARTVYFRDYLGGEQPRHTTLGLLAVAQAHEAHGVLYGDEDDEP